MFNARLEDDELLICLRENDIKLRNKAFNCLYRQYFSMINAYIRQNKGNEYDARDIFQDALIIFYENVRNGKFREQSKISTYLYAIARNLWLMKLRKGRIINELTDQNEQSEIPDIEKTFFYHNGELKPLLEDVFNDLSENCRELLHLFYYEKRNMTEIAKILGYKNEESAKSQKYRCMSRLIETIENNQLLKNKLKEVLL